MTELLSCPWGLFFGPRSPRLAPTFLCLLLCEHHKRGITGMVPWYLFLFVYNLTSSPI